LKTILRVFSYLRRYPAMAFAQLACAVAGTLMVVVFPAVTREVMDQVVPNKQWDRLGPLIGTALAAYFFQHLFNSLRIRLNNGFEQKVIFDLRSDLYEKLQWLPLRWFDNRPTGDIMTTVSEDVPSVERVLIDGIEQGLVSVLQIAVVGIFMFRADVELALVALVPVPFLMAGAVWYTRSAKERHRRVRRATSAMNSLLHDNVAGMRQIKAYAIENEEHSRFNRASEQVKAATMPTTPSCRSFTTAVQLMGTHGMTRPSQCSPNSSTPKVNPPIRSMMIRCCLSPVPMMSRLLTNSIFMFRPAMCHRRSPSSSRCRFQRNERSTGSCHRSRCSTVRLRNKSIRRWSKIAAVFSKQHLLNTVCKQNWLEWSLVRPLLVTNSNFFPA
jgi:ABC-type multidrug transport system fused ATPase/permease subunit